MTAGVIASEKPLFYQRLNQLSDKVRKSGKLNIGARSRDRTGTASRPRDFKSLVKNPICNLYIL